MSDVGFIPKIAQLPFKEPNFKVKRCSDCDALFICGDYKYGHCKSIESCTCDFCKIKTELNPELCKTTIIKAGTREPIMEDMKEEKKAEMPTLYGSNYHGSSFISLENVYSRYITQNLTERGERRENQNGEE